MSYEDQVLALFGEANPISEHDTLENFLRPRLEIVEQRTGNMTEQEVRHIDPTRPIVRKERRRGPVWGLAAAAAVLIIGTVSWIAFRDDGGSGFAATPVDDALSVAAAYFEAYNAGDVEEVLALFTPDATFSANFGAQTSTFWEQLLVWNAAQGTTLSPPDCTVTGEVSGESVTVSCPHNNLDILVQALDGPPVPIQLTLVVTPNGIRESKSIFGSPDFNTVAVPFRSWMSENHPEDQGNVGFGNWSTVEEAEQNGILNAQYADEWATFLEANGCTYLDGC